MIKRDITETVCEYDSEGKLVKKTVIERHEEEDNLKLGDLITTTPYEYDWEKYQLLSNQAGTTSTTTIHNDLKMNGTIQG